MGRSRLGRGATRVVAIVIALVLHLGLLIAWRTGKTPTTPQVGMDSGARGISLSLVSGTLGSVAAPRTQDEGREDAAGAAAPQADAVATEGSVISAANAPASEGDAHAVGVPTRFGASGEGATRGDAAPVGAGGGYDPWRSASLAPLSFAHVSAPGLWEQVAPCYRGDRSAAPVELGVVLGDQGEFVDAFRQITQMVVTPSARDDVTQAALVSALKACSPFHDVERGVAHRLTLIGPAAIVKITLDAPDG